MPGDLGLFVEALAWVVDSTNAGNPHYPMPTREAIGPRCRALLVEHPALAEALAKGGIEAVFLLGALGREEWAVLVAESHELSDRQIARVLGKKLGTVKATLHAARRKLRAVELGAAPPERVAA